MGLSETDFRRAERAMRKRMAGPRARSARYDRRRNRVVVSLDNGIEFAFSPELAQGLESATPADLDTVEITPSGLGLHWPKADADLYLPALLEGLFGSRHWMAARARRATTAAPATNGRRVPRRRRGGRL
jgi:hypothetical protein